MPRWAKLGVLAALMWSAAAAAAAAAATVCNGHSELCDRRYSNITFVGSHDSAFVGTSVADNQETSVADQLNQGVRFLQAQTHNQSGVVELCHTLCALADAGPLETYLGTIKTFLDANPNEVVTLLLTNQDGLSGSAFDAVFQSSGIKSYAFTPSGNLTMAQWPTMGQMIAMGQRLVVFMDFPAGGPVPYILNEFQSFIFETPFDTTDPTFPQCSIDRPSGASPNGRMILVNHFLDTNLSGILIPNRDAANVTNSASSIAAQSKICSGLYGRNPNFILLDWMSTGDGMPVQAMMNGLQYTPSVTNTTAGTATGTTSPGATTTTSSRPVAETTQPTVLKSASGFQPSPQFGKSSQLAVLVALAMLFAM